MFFQACLMAVFNKSILKDMICIISASSRDGNNSQYFANKCQEVLKNCQQSVQLFSLDQLPATIHLKNIYEVDNSVFSDLVEKYIIPADKFVFVIPEYNGSFPGLLKLFVDSVHPKHFAGKKAALLGVSTGRAGNLRGMDHLTDILHYLQVEVMSLKIPFSRVHTILDTHGEIVDDETAEIINIQMEKFVEF